jgi:hypothetical protein
VTAAKSSPNFSVKDEVEDDNQVAAPTATRTPHWHRAKIAHQECGWKGGDRGGSAEQQEIENMEKPKALTGKNKTYS